MPSESGPSYCGLVPAMLELSDFCVGGWRAHPTNNNHGSFVLCLNGVEKLIGQKRFFIRARGFQALVEWYFKSRAKLTMSHHVQQERKIGRLEAFFEVRDGSALNVSLSNTVNRDSYPL